jgi:hypothetical protein
MMADTLLRTVLWQGFWRPGVEWCELSAHDDGWRIAGTVLAAVEGEPMQVRYRAELDTGWATREVEVTVRSGDGSQERRLRLTILPEQRWQLRQEVDGSAATDEAEALRGLIDVDLGVTPSTNTLPIRRLAPHVGATVDVTAAWVRFPELTVEPLPQRYTRLSERRYRYESGGGAFVAELEVDELGLVVTYEGGWTRLAAANGSG